VVVQRDEIMSNDSSNEDKCWNGGKTNTTIYTIEKEVKVDKIQDKKLWERIKNQINDFTKPTRISGMGGVQRRIGVPYDSDNEDKK